MDNETTTNRTMGAQVLAYQWQEYAPTDPRLIEQMREVLELLGWPHLVLDNNEMNHCGTGQVQLEDYLYRLAANPNNGALRVKGQAAVKQLLDAAVQREQQIAQVTAASRWRAQHEKPAE